MMLNARKVEAAKGKEKSYKLFDGGGLYLQVEPNGSRYWRMKYRFAGKEKRLFIQQSHLLMPDKNEKTRRNYSQQVKIPAKSKKPKSRL